MINKSEYKLKSIKKFVHFSKANSNLLIYLIMAMILGALISFLSIITPKLVLDYLSRHFLSKTLLLILIIFFVKFIIKCLNNYFSGKAKVSSEILFNKAYTEISVKYVKLPYSKTLTKESIELLEGAKYGIWEIQGLCKKLEIIGTSIVSALTGVIIILGYDWKLILLPLAINCTLIPIYTKIGEIEVDNSKRLLPENRSFGWYCSLISNLNLGKEVRLYQAQEFIVGKFTSLADIIYKINHTAFSKKGLLLGLVRFLIQFQIILVIIFLALELADNNLSVGDFLLLFGAINSFSTAINHIQEQYSQIRKVDLLLKPFFQLLELPENLTFTKDKNESSELSACALNSIRNKLCIKFENVSFKYPGRKELALQNVSLTLSSGEKVALVGKNGAGKTTLIKLLCKFYQPASGRIFVNGIDINEIEPKIYSNLVSTVFQDFQLLPIRINENISSKLDNEITNNEADEIKTILSDNSFNSWVEKLPEKERTFLTPYLAKKYTNPSGGQQQNIAIARSIFKNAPINIFDEPTKSLSIEEEISAMKKFSNLSMDKIKILISHRLSHTKLVDRVIVLDNGEIIEEGNHYSLMEQKGLYYDMYTKQAEKYKVVL